MFAPTLNIPAPVLSMFLSDFHHIFETAVVDDEAAVSREVAIPSHVSDATPHDIRSPRRQLFQDLPTPAYNQQSFPKGVTASMGPTTSGGHQPSSSTSSSLLSPASTSVPMSASLPPGFTPLQPAYETSRFGHYLYAQGQPISASTSTSTSTTTTAVGGGGGGGGGATTEFISLNGSLASSASLSLPSNSSYTSTGHSHSHSHDRDRDRDVRAKRRESSLLMMMTDMGKPSSRLV